MGKAMKKYQYHILTWGGFYNEEYASHGQVPGDRVFDTEAERSEYLSKLRVIEKEIGAGYPCTLVAHLTEGFCCDIRTVIHRVVEFEGKQYYSEFDLGINCSFSAARYYIEDKWFPGFNDYPLGEDFDYDNAVGFKVVKEWITGADQEIDLT